MYKRLESVICKYVLYGTKITFCNISRLSKRVIVAIYQRFIESFQYCVLLYILPASTDYFHVQGTNRQNQESYLI